MDQSDLQELSAGLAQRLAQLGVASVEEGYHGPPIELLAGVVLERIEGNCPVQAYGTIDGRRYYFRARWDSWQVGVGTSKDDAIEATVELAPTAGRWACERDYEGGPFDAGWMPKIEALVFIGLAANLYRSQIEVTV